MTTDGFQSDPAALREAATSKAQPMIEASLQAHAKFSAAAQVPSSFPEIMSAQQSGLDQLLATLADAAKDGVSIAERYKERLLHTADLYERTEQANTDGLSGMEV